MNAVNSVAKNSIVELVNIVDDKVAFDSVLLKFLHARKISFTSFSFALRGLSRLGLDFKSFSMEGQLKILNKVDLYVSEIRSHRTCAL
jgi:hypothetical protein